MAREELSVDDLILDLENPRIGRVETQAEALEAIVRLDTGHFRTMMLSISEHGLDPGDSFYIVDEGDGDEWVVVDGNRRLAALKVLHEPAVLNGTGLGETIVKRLVKAAEDFDAASAELISCAKFDSRADANEWILRRHGRGMEGESRIPWGTLEIQRFQNDRTVLDVIDFVERNSTFSDDDWAQIRAEVEAKPSVLSRFLESKKGRDWLGMSTTEKDGQKIPVFNRQAEFVLDVLSTIFQGIHDKEIDTRSHNKASEIETYFDALPKRLHPSGKPSKNSAAFRDVKINDGKKRPRLSKSSDSKGKGTGKKKTTRTKGPRATLAPSKHGFVQPETAKGQALVREASRLRLAQTPLSAAFVLRAFLQHTVEKYMTDEGLPMWEANKKGNNVQLNLAQKAERVIQHLVANKRATGTDLRGVKRTLTGKTDPASIQALNDYHHDKYDVPAADVLRNAWDTAEPLFVAVYGAP
ncbi:hypothetical protein [Erythrobacter sp. AP23]|uniref:hypothetical protein n=1 Tax=Erythrobacter sp. AP23 TaxID=499656 RepID=UPI00076C0F2F|nr:hypothetical protein [Erythrobacter sp. AP23]KWV95944.1 hypothetical protein ASS64_01605 [Erythrobacter sp. AP23]